ncbi:TonB-dependent receptor [Hyphomicrobium sp. DY-1]|uniref:TonB-dependent receptor n=1 Tax=Hyphomicrobium sp. DY-1 TaxID=3075650 RepID=UPI0039C0391E
MPEITVEAAKVTSTKKAPSKKKTVASKKPNSLPQSASTVQSDSAAAAATMPTANPMSTLTPPVAYAGGQVATGGQLGMLGNRSVMDTPFNQTSFTAKTIQDQQARSVADVLLNDPSVRANQSASAGYGQDTFYIRGFYYDTGEMGLNGLYGIAPTYTTQPNYVDRIEVLKGPSALLNGMPPGGAVGGSINLVTKQAPDDPITQVTTTYQSQGLVGTELDYARRYGLNKEFGVRFNGSYGSGDTAIDDQHNEVGDAVLNLDYRGERLRLSADVGYQANDLTGVQRFITVVPSSLPTLVRPVPPFLPLMNGKVPPAPDASSNYGGMPWEYWNTSSTFAMVRGEYKLTDHVTAYGAYGWSDNNLDYLFASPGLLNANGDFVTFPLKGGSLTQNWAGNTGIRADFDTGPINHLFNVDYSKTVRDNVGRWHNGNAASCLPPPYNAAFQGYSICSNIYDPVPISKPTSFGPQIATLAETNLSSEGVSDTMSILDNRIQFTIGVRHQDAGADNTRTTVTSTEISSTDASVWSPAYALVVKPLRNVSLYANYIEGLQMGTTVGPTYANAGEALQPSQTTQKEVGVKVDFGSISTTFAAFDIAQPSLIAINNVLGYDGEQRNRGLEFNVFGELTPTLRLLGGVALIDGRLEKTADGTNDGHKAQGVPDTSVNMGAEWDTPIQGLTLNGRAIYTSGVYIDAANHYSIPDWTRYDVGARYTFDNPWNGKPMTVRFNVENVLDTNYYASSYSSDGIITVGAPRTYLVSSTVNF